MSLAADRQVAVLREELRAATSEVRRFASTVALSVPAVWGIDQLRAHYPGLGEERIKALLRKHCGYRGRQGLPIAVHVEVVRKLDAILAVPGAIEGGAA